MGSCSLCTCCLGGERLACRIPLPKWENTDSLLGSSFQLSFDERSLALEPSVYPKTVEVNIRVLEQGLLLACKYKFPKRLLLACLCQGVFFCETVVAFS